MLLIFLLDHSLNVVEEIPRRCWAAPRVAGTIRRRARHSRGGSVPSIVASSPTSLHKKLIVSVIVVRIACVIGRGAEQLRA